MVDDTETVFGVQRIRLLRTVRELKAIILSVKNDPYQKKTSTSGRIGCSAGYFITFLRNFEGPC